MFDRILTLYTKYLALLLNGYGLLMGYATATLCRWPIKRRRTLSIEIGMQNATCD